MRNFFHLASSRVFIAVSLRKVGFSSPRALHYLHTCNTHFAVRSAVSTGIRTSCTKSLCVCLQLSLRNILLKGAVCVRARAETSRRNYFSWSRDLSRLPYVRYASNIIGIHFADFWGNRRWIVPCSSSEETCADRNLLPRRMCYFGMRFVTKAIIMEVLRSTIAFITGGIALSRILLRHSLHICFNRV